LRRVKRDISDAQGCACAVRRGDSHFVEYGGSRLHVSLSRRG
jgi:hypothetical protein